MAVDDNTENTFTTIKLILEVTGVVNMLHLYDIARNIDAFTGQKKKAGKRAAFNNSKNEEKFGFDPSQFGCS